MHGDTLTRRTLFRSAAGAAALASLPGLALTARPAVAWAAASPGPKALPPLDPLVHLVNRITFGLNAEDLERAKALGFEGFVEEQLHPETIDDTEVEIAVRAGFPTLTLSPERLVQLEKKEVILELKAATVYRAIHSRRQLFEMMVDFWSNHFNIYHKDGQIAYFKTVDDRDVARRHALGRFRDLLGASAKSPAMLLYLDNATNTKEGPNENYGRELMELHTLGVDGGYTQADVEQVARAFTGWTVGRGGRRTGRVGTFFYNAANHDDGARTILGTVLPAGLGLGHGERVLDLLAGHPSTAKLLATKLVRRFVSDAPPPALVDAVSRTFTQTGGDLRETMRTLLLSAEFRASADQKLKRPLEVLAAAARTLGSQVSATAGRPLLNTLAGMGQLPFDWPAPNGYPDAAGAWGNTNGLLNRWNLGLSLGGNTLPGVRTDLSSLSAGVPGAPRPTAAALTDHLVQKLLVRPIEAADRNAIASYAANGLSTQTRLTQLQVQSRLPGLVALILDSPYFQWR